MGCASRSYGPGASPTASFLSARLNQHALILSVCHGVRFHPGFVAFHDTSDVVSY